MKRTVTNRLGRWSFATGLITFLLPAIGAVVGAVVGLIVMLAGYNKADFIIVAAFAFGGGRLAFQLTALTGLVAIVLAVLGGRRQESPPVLGRIGLGIGIFYLVVAGCYSILLGITLLR